MKINISEEMAETVIEALREHCAKHDYKEFGKGEYKVSNEEALWFFEALCA
jgi:hypothetical protein